MKVVIRTNIASFFPGWKFVRLTFISQILSLLLIHFEHSSGVVHPNGSENLTSTEHESAEEIYTKKSLLTS